MILWELLSGLDPMVADNLKDKAEKIDSLPLSLRMLIERCWTRLSDVDSEQGRPSFEEIIFHLLTILKETKEV